MGEGIGSNEARCWIHLGIDAAAAGRIRDRLCSLFVAVRLLMELAHEYSKVDGLHQLILRDEEGEVFTVYFTRTCDATYQPHHAHDEILQVADALTVEFHLGDATGTWRFVRTGTDE